MRFRRKPEEVEAIRVNDALDRIGVYPLWLSAACASGVAAERPSKREIKLIAPGGNSTAHDNDWIVRRADGELFVCRATEFFHLFEEAT